MVDASEVAGRKAPAGAGVPDSRHGSGLGADGGAR